MRRITTMLVLSLTAAATAPAAPPDTFGAYWYQGKAELTSYTLEQARYGEVYPGHAVLIFVTEDFSKSRQVKLDDPGKMPQDAVKVLKLNATRKFATGIYPYSVMTSVFTPVDGSGRLPRSLKVTTSAQEWCGHTFLQLNRTAAGWHALGRSYFESEGDREEEVEGALVEDELWTLVRLDPEALPTGTLRMIPGTLYQRLRHLGWQPQDAFARLEPYTEPGLLSYTVTYPDLDRQLTILFRRDFPHEIEGFEERYPSGFGPGTKPLTTRARRNVRMLLDYWNHHRLEDRGLRQALGLE